MLISLQLVYVMLVTMLVMILLMVVFTIGIKALRTLRDAATRSYYRRIEPALENFLVTGERQPELERLSLWTRDRFLATLMIERLAVLRGAGREYLLWLARDLGLVDKYLRDLRSRRRWTRARAAENLGYLSGELSVNPIAQLLGDEDDTVRAVAARALARIKSPEAARFLTNKLDDSSELSRLRAAENLERVGNLAVEPLSNLLGTPTVRGAVMAAQVLGNLRAREARDALKATLAANRDVNVHAQATLALGKIGDPEDLPEILHGARSDSWPVRAQAANALGLIGEVSTIPTLDKLLGDGAWWVRLNASRALAKMGPAGEEALFSKLSGEDRYASHRAAAALETHGITRRKVEELAAPGERGEKARSAVLAIARAGATNYLQSLRESLPEGEETRELGRILAGVEAEKETGSATLVENSQERQAG